MDLSRPDLVAAVFGAGTMGRGIAQVCAQAGLTTLLFDSRNGAVKEAIAAIDKGLEGLVSKGRMTGEVKQGVLGRLKPIGSLDEVKGAGVVVEAIVENLDAKRELFRELEKRLAPDAVIATNTSSLSVTEIAAGCAKPERVAGLHFFNPPPLMALVEVIQGDRTSEQTMDKATALVRQIGKTPARAKDTPGFIVNRVARPFYNEALRILGDGGASVEVIDRIMKEAGNFRMGPFELMDLIGHDINFAATESLYHSFFEDPRLRPSPIQHRMVMGGNLGRKTGRGFYVYDKK